MAGRYGTEDEREYGEHCNLNQRARNERVVEAADATFDTHGSISALAFQTI